MALPPFFGPARPGLLPPQPPPPAPFGCPPPPPLPSPAFPPPLPQRPGPFPGPSAPFLQPALALQPRPPAEAPRRGGGGGSGGGGFYPVPPPPLPPPPPQYRPFPGARLRGALRLVRRLRGLGQALREAEADGAAWALLHARATPLRAELAERLQPLSQAAYVGEVRRRLERVRRRRLRLRERARERAAEREAEAARAAEREQEIDRWRVKCVQEVEEKKREQELKAAADGVLAEVRKKQADTKRMVDILRALEKLRKLRKEAAARKGVCPPASADETFEHHLQRLRKLIKKRSELYEAEERALRVMLEGEQEEERKRELEKKQRKEKEKFLLQKREVESKLFGDPEEFPLAHLLQPFRQYYLQAEHSLPALIQIRHDWDQYLVPADHPKGSSVPQGWVLPPLPSNDVWASAMKLQ
ncbi:programmed cell death protein 7 [Octodon degus]|uniref:Programmed cell death protein 7 n=1 Tax=Octodon degus TaxID=10160 RepID=A0A6P3EP33_OCTDE|nr:programmed cell death protein 7 [Octodon degus]